MWRWRLAHSFIELEYTTLENIMFTPLNAYSARRQRLMAKIDDMPVVLAAGRTPSRNFPANLYSVRSSSHFLYFVGQQMNGAVLVLDRGQSVLYVN